MTIEIRQLIVRAVVEHEHGSASRQQSAPPEHARATQRAPKAPQLSAAERRSLIAECVREVLHCLERTRRR